MSKIEDIVKEMETYKNNLRQFLVYDYDVGGLVSKSIKNFEEAQILLNKATAESIKEALVKVKTVMETVSPYVSYVPGEDRALALEMMRALNSLIEKISQL